VLGGVSVVVTERDEKIIREVDRWRGLLGRQIKEIGNFTGTRATDRRLKKLVEAKYLSRKKYIYGVASIYQITEKSHKKFDLGNYLNKMRLEQLEHDIMVVDTYLYFKKRLGLEADHFMSEKEIRHQQGFTTRGHVPDFIFNHQGKTYAVEVELSQKAKDKLEKNIKENYIHYDRQFWILNNPKLKRWLMEFKETYPNIEIMETGVIDEYTKSI